MKKSCLGCKALSIEKFCQLGYKTNTKRVNVVINGKQDFYTEPVPLEQCPKPLTFKKLMELK